MERINLFEKQPRRAWVFHTSSLASLRGRESVAVGIDIKPQVTEIGNVTYWLNGTQYLWDGAVIVELERGKFRVYPMEEVVKHWDIK